MKPLPQYGYPTVLIYATSLSKPARHTPASSVPCERIFSKAGEVVSKKRNRLSPGTVEKKSVSE